MHSALKAPALLSVFEEFTRAYLFQITLEIMRLPVHTAYIRAMHLRLVHTNKLSLWLNCSAVWFSISRFLVFPFLLFLSLMADVQYPAPAIRYGGQGPQPVARPAAHAEIPPAAVQGVEGVR